MEDLTNKIEDIIKNCECNSDEKKILNDAYQRFSKMVTEALHDTYLKQLGLIHLDSNVREKLNDIMITYESIFSWNIIQLTGKNSNLMMEHINVIKEKIEEVSNNEDEFSVNR